MRGQKGKIETEGRPWSEENGSHIALRLLMIYWGILSPIKKKNAIIRDFLRGRKALATRRWLLRCAFRVKDIK